MTLIYFLFSKLTADALDISCDHHWESRPADWKPLLITLGRGTLPHKSSQVIIFTSVCIQDVVCYFHIMQIYISCKALQVEGGYHKYLCIKIMVND